MSRRNRVSNAIVSWFLGGLISGAVLSHMAHADDPQKKNGNPEFRAAMLTADVVTSDRLTSLASDSFNAVVIVVEGTSAKKSESQRRAAKLVLKSSLELHYWIEVARCPELADRHPEWMASLQTHDEWRRFFPKTPQPSADEVAKTYPWVPILSREPYTAQLDRVKKLLANKPTPKGVFLNDLQGAPSACGCGNPLCRWTSDYGKRRTTIPLGDDAATLFVNAVKKFLPKSKVVPVWATECEEHDGAADGLCSGVGCFDGICWKAYIRQLGPLEQACEKVAVLVPYRMFERDLPRYGADAGWVRHAVESFSNMPPRHKAKPVKASRLITVLQGWDVSEKQVAQQIQVSTEAGVSGYVVAFQKIEQSWQPRLVRWR